MEDENTTRFRRRLTWPRLGWGALAALASLWLLAAALVPVLLCLKLVGWL